MSFLLDTNVLSEWNKPIPNTGVVAWLADVDEDRVFVSVVSLAELRYGIDRLSPGSRRRRLDSWLRRDLIDRFEGRIIGIDAEIAATWGSLVATREAGGQPIGPMDAFIAATANTRGLALVTRNVSDFDASVERVINPWVGADA